MLNTFIRKASFLLHHSQNRFIIKTAGTRKMFSLTKNQNSFMKVIALPLNSDNYGYLLVDEESKEAAVVDVSNQPEIVYRAIQEAGVHVTKVLTTHKHWDHAGGNDRMKELIPNVEVLGSAQDEVEGCTRVVADGEEFFISGIKVRCILSPGHTMGHVCYFAEKGDQKVCFTGDTLFIGGAGRFFEGTANDMYPTLFEKLGSLPEDTLIYCGHEYTLSNYRFALSLEPTNPDLIQANQEAESRRQANEPTVPSTLRKEFKTNPFLRVQEPSLLTALCRDCDEPNNRAPIAVLAAVREAKNNFK